MGNRRVAVDSSALIAYANGDRQAVALFLQLMRSDVLLIAPAPVFAETLRGKPADAAIHRALKKLEPVAATCPAGRRAGELLGAGGAPAGLTIDALIQGTAIEAGADAIITTDVDDHERIAPEHFVVIPLHTV